MMRFVTFRQVIRTLMRRGSRAKDIRRPFVGLALALPEDDPDKYPYLSFGVGCFHFGANPDRFDGNAKKHVEAIGRLLEGSEFVSQVQIRDQEQGWFESSLPFGLEEGGQPFPAIRNLRIDFRLELPVEDQRRFYPWGDATEPTVIDVSIRQGVTLPIAYVVPRTGRRDFPGSAVTLTWHALRTLGPGDSEVMFDMRGPSPMHMQCFLVPLVEPNTRADSTRTFEYERVALDIGVPYATFAYDPRAFRDIDSAADALFSEVEGPAGLYYEIQGASRRLHDQWDELTTRRDELAGFAGRGFKPFMRRRFSQGSLLRTLAIDLVEFEGEVDSAETRYGEARRDLADVPSTGFLLEEIDELLRTRFSYATERVSNLLTLFETRRLSRAQNRAVFAGALLAAAVGALSAILLSRPAHAPVVTVINGSTTRPAIPSKSTSTATATTTIARPSAPHKPRPTTTG